LPGAGAAEHPLLAFVGQDALHRVLEAPHSVRPGHLGERVAVRAVAELEVRAVVVHDLDADALEDAVLGDGQLGVVEAVTRQVFGGDEVVDAVLHELHGPARSLGEHAGDPDDLAEDVLGAEAPAHVHRVDVELGGRHLDGVGDQPADIVDHVGVGPHVHLLGDRVVAADRAGRLERLRAGAVPAELSPDHPIGSREVGGDVAERERLLEGEIARQRIVELDRARLHRLERIGDHRQGLVLDVDQRHRVLGGVAVDGGHRRHRLPDEPDLVHRQAVLYDRLGAEGGQRVRHLFRVLAGGHGKHAGQRAGPARVDARDARVGMRAPEDGGVEHAGKLHIVGVGGAAGEELRVLEARDVLADPAALRRGHGDLLQRAAGALAWLEAARPTASTMPW